MCTSNLVTNILYCKNLKDALGHFLNLAIVPTVISTSRNDLFN